MAEGLCYRKVSKVMTCISSEMKNQTILEMRFCVWKSVMCLWVIQIELRTRMEKSVELEVLV